ncbi:MAG: DUF2442 domain-containing protein, partial [Bacteroidaceae bacterium]|nr:DUF2442 domain-containing protein [Bacteroidaceae bacterium]
MATPEEREKYELWAYGISWSELDEDMSYESFYYEDAKEPANGIQAAFLKNPYLNISAVARKIGIQQSLLASYIKGTKKPSDTRKAEILDAIHEIGHSLLEVSF